MICYKCSNTNFIKIDIYNPLIHEYICPICQKTRYKELSKHRILLINNMTGTIVALGRKFNKEPVIGTYDINGLIIKEKNKDT